MQKSCGGQRSLTSAMKRRMEKSVLSGFVLQGVVAFLAGADLDDVLYIINEDFTVADVAGIEDLTGSVDHQGDRMLGSMVASTLAPRK